MGNLFVLKLITEELPVEQKETGRNAFQGKLASSSFMWRTVAEPGRADGMAVYSKAEYSIDE